ncbi:MAG: DHH family phosphoesterase [Bacteroidales bacterium]|nr:DHH family phosphoesterase [Bacteroidales bacterium]
MIERENALLLSKWIDSAEVISAVCHARPDGDAAGCVVAAALYASLCRGKDALIILPDAAPASIQFIFDQAPLRVIDARSNPLEAGERLRRTDLLFCLDFNTLSRTEGLEEALRSCPGRKVLVDHHQAPALEEFDLCFSSTGVSSACELLYNLLLQMPDIDSDASRLPLPAATALMCGMTTDTNNFANSVFPGTLRMASELLAAGVDRGDLIDKLYFSERPNRIAAQGEMLSSKMSLLSCGVAVTVLDKSFYERHALLDGETEGFVNIPLTIKDIKLSILAREEDGRLRVSLRSKRGVSARELAVQSFHGGGHEQASGGKILIPDDIASPSLAQAYIEDVAARFMRENYAIEK